MTSGDAGTWTPSAGLLTRGLAALRHSLKHVLGAIFCKISSPRARHVLGER